MTDHAFLIYNGFWNPQGPPESAVQLVAAATAQGFTLTPTPHTDWCVWLSEKGVTVSGPVDPAGQTVLFWDKDIRLATALEAAGARLYNSASAIALCDDKWQTHRVLAAAGIPMPKTLAAPMAYVRPLEAGCRAFWAQAATLGFPLVVKECFGSLGGQVYLAHNADELRQLTLQMGAKPFLAQQFVAESAGNDKRLYVVDNRVVAAMRRHSDTDFRANIENGGKGFAYTPTARETELALTSCRLLGLHFGGVDLLDSANGPLACEVNSNAHMSGIMQCTGVDVAAVVVRCVFKGNENIPPCKSSL